MKTKRITFAISIAIVALLPGCKMPQSNVSATQSSYPVGALGYTAQAYPLKVYSPTPPPTIRFWSPGGIGVIQAGLMNNLGHR
jgi:hypothetical protein